MISTFQKLYQGHRLIHALVTVVVLALWAVVIAFTFAERDYTLERIRTQLEVTAITLADFNELAARVEEGGDNFASEARSDVLWRALLQYPEANIWVESLGDAAGGVPASALADSILVQERRDHFTVFASLPREVALAAWRRGFLQRLALLGLATGVLLLFSYFLARNLRARGAAEREAATAQERNRQMRRYHEQLEFTVTERTRELAHANDRLGEELAERKSAEKTLREHDALLSAVAKGAAELLGSHSLEQAIPQVLSLIGRTVGVGRVQLNALHSNHEGKTMASLAWEWCRPDLETVVDDPVFSDMNLNEDLPKQAQQLMAKGLAIFHLEDLPAARRPLYQAAGMRNFLQIPIQVENAVWGFFSFIDDGVQEREWNWAETDTLLTLANLVGVAMTRARYVQELADANMIVQNSPTILYRLKGAPRFPLIYISHNITKFGHTSEKLMGSPDWTEALVAEEDREALLEAMRQMLESGGDAATLELRLRCGDGGFRWVENRYTPVRDKNGRLVEVEGIIIDITERKQAEEKIATLARTDALTGLANRATFIERLRHAFAGAKRGTAPFAILYLDLDHFKTINDTLGHPTGDKLLKEVAERLRQSTRETDLVARLGGDEYAVLQTGISEPANAGSLAQSILERMRRPFRIDGNELRVGTSIGICPFTEESGDPDSMLAQADLALYRAKDEGRNCYRFHSSELDQLVTERSVLADELRQALERGELELFYQPQYGLQDGEVSGIEAVVLWRHPQRGLLPAEEFLPVAEKTGIILAVGEWMLDEACRQLRAWRDEGIALPVITLNLSPAQLKSGHKLLHDVVELSARHGLRPADLEFDVTEAMLAQLTFNRSEVLSELRLLGCRIAIDNFGSQYSSFDYLREYRVNHLKISHCFIERALKDAEWAKQVGAIVGLAQDLGIGLSADSLDSEEQQQWLRTLEADGRGKGYYYGRPVNRETAGGLLRDMRGGARAGDRQAGEKGTDS